MLRYALHKFTLRRINCFTVFPKHTRQHKTSQSIANIKVMMSHPVQYITGLVFTGYERDYTATWYHSDVYHSKTDFYEDKWPH